jgi:hypothetical protein
MAVCKSTRRFTTDTNEPLKQIFRESPVSKDREKAWIHALLDSETGDPPLAEAIICDSISDSGADEIFKRRTECLIPYFRCHGEQCVLVRSGWVGSIAA